MLFHQNLSLYSPYRGLFTERDRDLAAFAKERSKLNKLKSFIQNATAEHDFSLFFLDQRRKPRLRSV